MVHHGEVSSRNLWFYSDTRWPGSIPWLLVYSIPNLDSEGRQPQKSTYKPPNLQKELLLWLMYTKSYFLRFFSTISIAQIFPVFKVFAEICIFLRFIGVKKQIKNTILYMRPVQERQQSLSLMEKLNSEKRTREQLQEDVAKLQVSFTVNLQFVIKLDTKKQKMFLFLISK